MISTAILLAAGEGSRLRSAAPFKPLCTVAGHSLIWHALHGLAEAGLKRVVVVLGYGADQIAAHIAEHRWAVAVETVMTSDYRLPNGTSVLAAEPLVGSEQALLAMCDHLVEPALYRLVAQAGASDGARLGIDRRIENNSVDLDDVYRRELRVEGVRSATPRHLREAVALLPELELPRPTVLPLERFAEGPDLYRRGQVLKVVFVP